MEVERVEGEVVGPQLSAEEARALTDEVAALADELWRKLLRLYEGRAHIALGYANWGDYFTAEFRRVLPRQKVDPKHGYRVLRAARVEAEISVHMDTQGMTEAQARELRRVPEGEERLRLARWVESAGGWTEVSAPRLKRKIEEERGNVAVVRTTENPDLDVTAWNRSIAREMRTALSYLYEALDVLRAGRPRRLRHFVLPEALRELPTRQARAVRERIEEERGHVAALRAALKEVAERLDFAAEVLDARPDLDAPPPAEPEQITVEDAIEDA